MLLTDCGIYCWVTRQRKHTTFFLLVYSESQQQPSPLSEVAAAFLLTCLSCLTDVLTGNYNKAAHCEPGLSWPCSAETSSFFLQALRSASKEISQGYVMLHLRTLLFWIQHTRFSITPPLQYHWDYKQTWQLWWCTGKAHCSEKGTVDHSKSLQHRCDRQPVAVKGTLTETVHRSSSSLTSTPFTFCSFQCLAPAVHRKSYCLRLLPPRAGRGIRGKETVAKKTASLHLFWILLCLPFSSLCMYTMCPDWWTISPF